MPNYPPCCEPRPFPLPRRRLGHSAPRGLQGFLGRSVPRNAPVSLASSLSRPGRSLQRTRVSVDARPQTSVFVRGSRSNISFNDVCGRLRAPPGACLERVDRMLPRPELSSRGDIRRRGPCSALRRTEPGDFSLRDATKYGAARSPSERAPSKVASAKCHAAAVLRAIGFAACRLEASRLISEFPRPGFRETNSRARRRVRADFRRAP